MHIAANALVLRSVDYKESDKILTLLAEDLGKLTASARGCRRKGSALAAGCRLLCWSEMELYDYNGRWTVKAASPQREFRRLGEDFGKFALACYFAEVAELLAVEGEPSPGLLSLLLNSLYALDRLDRPAALIKAAFELRCMCLAGYEPLLDGCAVCGAETPEDPRFHLREGVLHCAACGEPGDESLPLDGDLLAAMRHIAYGDPKRLFSFRLGGEKLARLGSLTERYLLTQLDRGFRTLDYYKQL